MSEDTATIEETIEESPRERQQRIYEEWKTKTPEEREALKRGGSYEPVDVDPEQEFNLLTPDHPGYQKRINEARADTSSGLRDIRDGKLPVTDELRAEIEEVAYMGQNYPASVKNPLPGMTGHEGGEAIQKAAAMIEAARNQLQGEPHPRMAPVSTPLFEDPSKVTVSDIGSWSMRDKQTFRQEHPDEWSRLKFGEGSESEHLRDPLEVSLGDFQQMAPQERLEFMKTAPREHIEKLKGIESEERDKAHLRSKGHNV